MLQGCTHQASDARMIGRAVREQWQIPREAYQELPKALYQLARGAEREAVRIRCSEVLLAMDRVIQADEHLAVKLAAGDLEASQVQHVKRVTLIDRRPLPDGGVREVVSNSPPMLTNEPAAADDR